MKPASICLLIAALVLPQFAWGETPEEFFEKKIRPVLVKHCYECHSAAENKSRGGLQLDTRAGIRHGGDTGPAVVPEKPDESWLLEAIRYESYEMPPSGKLPDAVIADFETWIRAGAADPRDGEAKPAVEKTIDFEQARKFWSFQPPQKHPLPKVSHPQWVQRPLDAFVLAQQEAAGLAPNSPADKATLLRRLAFDLTGLPPTPEEVASFVQDSSPDAYERMVDQYLASPHYGERWARLWLDIARYAEDQAHIVGNNRSLFYPNAYLYRDWVIEALNQDLPFDQFIKLQLAADLMEEQDEQVALGFIGLGPKYYRRGSLEVVADEWEDRVDTVSRGLLGLTVACARCHDHKYDPIPTQDYYSLAGVFASTQMFNAPLNEKVEKKNGQAKDPKDAMHIVKEEKNPQNLNVFIRGDVKAKGEEAPRRFLRILCDEEPQVFQQGSGRLELAEAIVDRENPLAARVFVNRVWGQYFGQYLVDTPSNFGTLGSKPSHPELLDDLAVRFMESGWSLKWLHREIVLSATYQQSSELRPEKAAIDEENRLLWRQNRRRLSVESYRDAMLAASGRLDRSVGGESIDPQDPQETRRTIYSRVSRLDLNPMLALFDFPDPNAHSARRVKTNTSLQKLFLLNSPFMVEHAKALTKRLQQEAKNDQQRIERAYRLLYARDPNGKELEIGLAFLTQANVPSELRWHSYAQALLAANEMMFLD